MSSARLEEMPTVDDLRFPVNLKNHPLEDLCARLAPLELPEVMVRRLMARVILRNTPELTGMRGLSKVVQARLEAHTIAPRLTLVERVESPVDHFVKYLFRTHDGHLVETVRIPLLAHRYTVCISSQVGCALGCTFCATGKLGFRRNLEPWEMVDQVLQVREGADRPVTGAVFMGQGEPFLNYDHVIKAATILREPTGASIKAENITISTVGIVPAIRRYTREAQPFRLIFSLHAGTSQTRRRIMPIDRKYPLEEVVAAIREYTSTLDRRAIIAWVAMAGINTGEEELIALKRQLEGVPALFNLITVNDPTGEFVAPEGEAWSNFLDRLRALEMPIVRRYTGGRDVNAACGMLASSRAERESAS